MLKYEAPYELTKGTAGSAGWDLQATEPVTIAPFGSAIISTGVKLEIPEGYYAQVCQCEADMVLNVICYAILYNRQRL